MATEHGGNWLESRMCRLGGEFAGMLRVDIPKDHQAALEAALHNLDSHGLTVHVRVDSGEDEAPAERMLALEIFGPDRPGIVQQITAALAMHGVNVEEFNSECGSAPMSGEMLFNAHILIQIPIPTRTPSATISKNSPTSWPSMWTSKTKTASENRASRLSFIPVCRRIYEIGTRRLR